MASIALEFDNMTNIDEYDKKLKLIDRLRAARRSPITDKQSITMDW